MVFHCRVYVHYYCMGVIPCSLAEKYPNFLVNLSTQQNSAGLTLQSIIRGYMSPQHGASSACGWRIGFQHDDGCECIE
jgi:hypothetical protein